MTVIDYKYGQGVAVDAKDNPQMKLYALGAMNDWGFAYETEQIEMNIYQPRIGNISTDTISAEDLLQWANETVKPVAIRASFGAGEYIPGAHCKFCPHAGRCPELNKLCTTYVETHGAGRVPVQTMAPFEIAEALKMIPMVELWIKRIQDSALTGMLNGNEIPGYKVVAGRSSRQWADELEVAQTLKTHGYDMEDITKTELLSVAAMEKALGKKKVAELLGDSITTKQGSPTIAQASDKRPAYDREAEIKKDFE